MCEEFEREVAMELEFLELEVIDLVRLVLRFEMGLEEGCRCDLNNGGWLDEVDCFWLGLDGAFWLGWDEGCSWNVLVVADEEETCCVE
jgi:hypothetical protein